MVAEVLLAVAAAVTPVGAFGAPWVMAADAADATDVPAGLVAVTVKV